MRMLHRFIALAVVHCVGLVPAAFAQDAPASGVLFENVRVFNGKDGELSVPSNVLVVDNRIQAVSASAIPLPAGVTVQRIAGQGRTLMPGLIDNHWHTMFARPTPVTMFEADMGYINLLAGAEATATLMRGFTTVRDMGGPSFGLKRAIDEGLVVGPRIYPSGAMITITGGHGDFRSRRDLPRQIGGPLTYMEILGASMVADSPDEVRVRAREQLSLGASQVKLTAGGGVASPHSPLDVATFNEDELRAAVQAAENWGTYVATHAYTPIAIQRAVNAGVKVIEHGHLMDETTARIMAEKGVWLSFQPFTDDGHVPPMAPENMRRLQQVFTGTDRTVALAKKYKLKMAFGTDILFSADGATRQGEMLATMGRWYTPLEALRMATATNGELLKLSGPRDPYPGTMGVVEVGALADLIVVNGNPLADLSLVADPAKNFAVIMKDGKIYKNQP